MATKRARVLAAKRAEVDDRRRLLVQEGKALSEAADRDNRLKTPAETQRGEAILAELDENKAELDRISAEMRIEDRLAEHEQDEIVRVQSESAGGTPGRRGEYEFRSFGEFLQAVAVKSAPVLASRIANADLLKHKLDVYQAAASGMSTGSPADGGYLVRTDWSTAMLDRTRAAATLFPLTRNVPIGADFDSLEYPFVDETSRATGSRWGGVQVYWKSEADTVTAKAPKIGRGELRLEELMGIAYATERLLRDSTAIEGVLNDAFASEFAFVVDNAIFRGDGVGKPKGLFGSAAYIEVAKKAAQVAATVVAENVTAMYAAMPSRLKGSAVWLIHQDVMSQLPLMAIGQQPVWLPPGGLVTAPGGMLMGRPVYEIEQAEALGTGGDIIFAAMNEYVTITKSGEGLRAETSMHLRFIYDEMTFRWVYRINGQPTWRSAVTMFKGANKMAPFIGVAVRS